MKCQSEEQNGNLFLLLCITSTALGGEKLQTALQYNDRTWKKWLHFVKLYLSMEAWFHDSNPKEEVNNARPLIAKVLQLLQRMFPREGTGNEYNLPKMHAMTKFQFYMKRYGSAINFYGGTGESAHKQFVKAPGQKTQRRITEFASQVANQYYSMLVTKKALRSIKTYDNTITKANEGMQQCTYETNDDVNIDNDNKFELSGKYSLRITESVAEKAGRGEDIYPQWKTNLHSVKNNNYKFGLHPRLVNKIIKKVNDMDITDVNKVHHIEGYTRLTTISHDGNRVIYYANPHIQGRMWYGWAYVHFEEVINGVGVESLHLDKILGFIKFEDRTKAVIQCTEKPLRWFRVK
jgi:hypothetical protein